jgi:hypothetical protein
MRRRLAIPRALGLCAAVLGCLPAVASAARAWQSTQLADSGSGWVAQAITPAGDRVLVASAPDFTATVFPADGGPPERTMLASGAAEYPGVASGGGETTVAWEGPASTVMVATRPDGGTFGPATAALAGSGRIQLQMDDAGDAALMFVRYTNGFRNRQLFIAIRPAGASSFGTAQPISDVVPSSSYFYDDDMAMTPDGQIVAAWAQPSDGGSVIETARTSVGSQVPPLVQTVSPATGTASAPKVAVDDAGDAVVTWVAAPLTVGIGAVQAAIAPSGSGFGGPFALGGSSGYSDGPNVAADHAGHALVAWPEKAPEDGGYGAGPPRVVSLDLPAGHPSSPADLTRRYSDGPVLPVFGDDGSAAVFFANDRLRAAWRPAPGSAFGPAQALSCSSTSGHPLLASFAQGSYELLWDRWGDDAGIWVTANREADAPAPGPCPGDVDPAPSDGTVPNLVLPSCPPTCAVPQPVLTPEEKARAALYQAIIAVGQPTPVEPIVAANGATVPFASPSAGRIRIWWFARKTLIATASTAVGAGKTQVPITLTTAGRRMLRRTAAIVKVTAWGSYEGGGQKVIAKQLLWLNPAVDFCAGVPRGVRCSAGLSLRTAGGARNGKVSHRGWPAVDGVLWIADHAGRSDFGTPYNDELLGGHGSDRLAGGAGDDILWGDEWPDHNNTHQRDHLSGGPGDDWLYASHGPNVVRGGSGDDTIWAVYAVRVDIDAGSGDDTIVARRGHGTIDCGPGHDTVQVPRHGYRLVHCERVTH